MNRGLCIFGEVLFDHFPDGSKVMGGAPFNVAWHLNAFGQKPLFISRVGNDAEGRLIRKIMHDWKMSTIALQEDTVYPTGRVAITFVNDQPEYEIVSPCAYDQIESAALEQLDCHTLYHGSLALRHDTSKAAIRTCLQAQPENLFIDVNLRTAWWKKNDILEMLKKANWVKMNTEEMDLLFASDKTAKIRMAQIISENHLTGLILTHGSKGAELMTSDGEYHMASPGKEVEVIDTVGAGDAFASVFILGLNNNWPMATILQRAQDFASSMVERRGATVTDAAFYHDFIHQWQLK